NATTAPPSGAAQALLAPKTPCELGHVSQQPAEHPPGSQQQATRWQSRVNRNGLALHPRFHGGHSVLATESLHIPPPHCPHHNLLPALQSHRPIHGRQ